MEFALDTSELAALLEEFMEEEFGDVGEDVLLEPVPVAETELEELTELMLLEDDDAQEPLAVASCEEEEELVCVVTVCRG